MARLPFSKLSDIFSKRISATIKVGEPGAFSRIANRPKNAGRRRDRGDGRTAEGKFTGKGGYGKDYETYGLDKLERTLGPIERRQVRASVDGAQNGRFYDGLIENPDKTYTGIEIKGGGAGPELKQRNFDGLVSPSNPARATLDGKPIVITDVMLETVKEIP